MARITITVNREIRRTKSGDVHLASRNALISQARREHQNIREAACEEISYYTSASPASLVGVSTLTFNTDHPVSWGF